MRRQRGEALLAARGGVLDEPVLEQPERGQGGRAGDRVAAVRRAVGAGAPGLHERGSRHDRREGHAGGDALGREQDVRLHAPVLHGPHGARAAGARLDLVGDEQDAVAVAELAEALQEAGPRAARSRPRPGWARR